MDHVGLTQITRFSMSTSQWGCEM